MLYIKASSSCLTRCDVPDSVLQVPRWYLSLFFSTPHRAAKPPPLPFALHTFPNFAFFISPSDSVVALWIQSSHIYKKPLNALQFWRRGGERDYYFFFSSSPSPAHPFYGLYLCWHSSSPSHFPSDLIPLSFPPRELMTRLRHEPNQGQALIRRQNASPSLDPSVDWHPPSSRRV